MNASFKIPIHKLNLELIKEIQEKYGDVELEIIVNQKPDFQALKDSEFWELINLLDWEQSTDEAIIEPIIQKLVSLSATHIYNFQEILTQKLYLLDQKVIAENIGDYAYQTGVYFSADNFLHARACVVANGKEAFEEVLSQPKEMFKNITFEPLLSVASIAYTRKTSQAFIYIPSHSPETFSNKEGWQNKTDE